MSLSFWLMRVSPKVVSINDINEENVLNIGIKSEIVSIISELYPDLRLHHIVITYQDTIEKTLVIFRAGEFF